MRCWCCREERGQRGAGFGTGAKAVPLPAAFGYRGKGERAGSLVGYLLEIQFILFFLMSFMMGYSSTSAKFRCR